MSQLFVGFRAPDFELTNPDGRLHRLSTALGEGPVVLVFYKAECPTSQFTFPYLQKIFASSGANSRWRLWGISQDDHDETRQFGERYGIGFDLLADDYPFAVSTAYGLESVPGIFIIQPDGRIGLSDYGFSKEALNSIAILASGQQANSIQLFHAEDRIPARIPG